MSTNTLTIDLNEEYKIRELDHLDESFLVIFIEQLHVRLLLLFKNAKRILS